MVKKNKYKSIEFLHQNSSFFSSSFIPLILMHRSLHHAIIVLAVIVWSSHQFSIS